MGWPVDSSMVTMMKSATMASRLRCTHKSANLLAGCKQVVTIDAVVYTVLVLQYCAITQCDVPKY